MTMCFLLVCLLIFFFFKHKTAYEMRISDWSSDVCSSDLMRRAADGIAILQSRRLMPAGKSCEVFADPRGDPRLSGMWLGAKEPREIGRASCRERVCQYV